MSIFSKWFSRKTKEKEPEAVSIGNMMSGSGKNVTEDKALAISAVFACVRILSQGVASLPLVMYQKTKEGRVRAYWRAEHQVLQRPNPFMDSFTFREVLMTHLAFRGNAYCEKEYVGSYLAALYPIHPDRVNVKLVDGQPRYEIDGKLYGRDTILHLRGFGTDNLVGKSILKLAAESMGLALATEEYGAKFFANDARPGGVIQAKGALTEDAQKRLKASWEEAHKGSARSSKVAVLEEGLEYKPVAITPEDAQFLLTRKFQTLEIARFFGVQPHKLGDLDRASFSNIEHQSLEFVQDTLRPWLVRLEQAFHAQLIPFANQESYYFEFLIDGLLRGDIKSRYEAYGIARQWGWMSGNDVRRLENQPSFEGGDEYWRPGNMVPVGQKQEQGK